MKSPLYPVALILDDATRKLEPLKLPAKPWMPRKLGKTYQAPRNPKCRVTDDLSKRL